MRQKEYLSDIMTTCNCANGDTPFFKLLNNQRKTKIATYLQFSYDDEDWMNYKVGSDNGLNSNS